MDSEFELGMESQPDDSTCGPTCLHAVYRWLGLDDSLQEVIERVPASVGGGTLAVMLANDALQRGLRARMLSFNLLVFDPSWFDLEREQLLGKLESQRVATVADDPKLSQASQHYIEFLQAGGELQFGVLNRDVIRDTLAAGLPILTGLSATFLYGCQRERGEPLIEDDIHGKPQGHFVVLSGYSDSTNTVTVVDPLSANPICPTRRYPVAVDRLIQAILLGILTFDGNLLILQPQA